MPVSLTLQRCGLALALLGLAACSQLEAIFGPDHAVVIVADFDELAAGPDAAEDRQELVRQSEKGIRERLDAVGIMVQSLTFLDDQRIELVVSDARSPSRISRLLNTIGRVEVRVVDSQADAADLEQGIAPPGRQIVQMGDGSGLMAVHQTGALEDPDAIIASASRDE